jgi:hypothetical protein
MIHIYKYFYLTAARVRSGAAVYVWCDSASLYKYTSGCGLHFLFLARLDPGRNAFIVHNKFAARAINLAAN